MKKTDRQYLFKTLDESEVDPDPIRQFDLWYEDALRSDTDLPNAFALSTVSEDGAPSSRILLLKGADARGFVFYTNSHSRKVREALSNPRAAICFFWETLERQVRIEGVIENVDDKQADEYFAQRPRQSQIGAWASPQGEVVNGRRELDEKFERCEARFKGTVSIPRPPFWNGYRLVPSVFEFWQGRAGRMHDRIRYTLNENSDDWTIQRLAP